MADKFIALGIHAALPVLKNYDVYLDKAKHSPIISKLTHNQLADKARNNPYLEKANDVRRRSLSRLRKRAEREERELNERQTRSNSVGGHRRGSYSSDYDSEISDYKPDDRGRRQQPVVIGIVLSFRA